MSNIPAAKGRRMLKKWMLLTLCCCSLPLQAEVTVQDDTGRSVRIPQAATRIVSLAPHLTEQLFAIGAGEKIVGAVDYSDYPEAAKAIPRVGDTAAWTWSASLYSSRTWWWPGKAATMHAPSKDCRTLG